MTDKFQVLTENLAYRNDSIESYQINIDNYTYAIKKIDSDHSSDSDLSGPFRAELVQRLKDELIQQRREIVIRDVIADQLRDLQPPTPEAE